MDHLDIFSEEVFAKLTTSSEIDQIEPLLRLIVKVIGWIRVSLHDLPFEELTEAKFEHQ